METIDINHKYEPLFTSSDRYCFLSGSRGSGKSFVIALYLVNLLLEGNNILFTRNTMTQAHISIIPLFTEMIELMNLRDKFIIKQKEIICVENNAVIYFRGLRKSSKNESANLKSLNVNIFVIEEAIDCPDYETFNTVNLSIRDASKQNKVILLFNPSNPNHWIYEKFYKNGEIADATYIHTTYLDNMDNLHHSFIDEAERCLEENYELYKHLFLGEWYLNTETLIFQNFRKGTVEEFDNEHQEIYGLDFGFQDKNGFVAVKIDDKNKKIYLEELIYQNRISNDELYELISGLVEINETIHPKYSPHIRPDIPVERKRVKNGSQIIADSADPKTINFLRQKSLNIVPVNKPKILNRLRFIQGFELIIHPNSHNLYHEISNYRFREGTEIIDNESAKNDHLINAFEYAVSWFYRL